MFKEWDGQMNWPLDPFWKCEVCENKPLLLPARRFHLMDNLETGLEWGLIHGICRCTKCHAKYNMRDRDGQRVTKPISLLKPKYKAAAKHGWEPLQLPLDQWTDDMWTAALEWAKEATETEVTQRKAKKGEEDGQQGVSVSVQRSAVEREQ